jgi:hypothetical protein
VKKQQKMRRGTKIKFSMLHLTEIAGKKNLGKEKDLLDKLENCINMEG